MLELTINDRVVQVPDGLNVLQAAKHVGVEIPHFCYHPGLSVAGSCRMCQVEIEQGGRKRIDLSCSNAAVDGMIVRTNTPAVVKAVKGVLEFLLMNHPIDCPICDDAGECKLQNYYMLHGLYDSRLNVEKWHKPKVHPVGPTVVLDCERCVLCSRCVRFCDEIWGERQLGIFGHGSNEKLINYPGRELDNPYSGNVVDLCPVGALLDKDFRFQRRVWYLKSVKSICPLCSRGCNIYLHYDVDHDYQRPGRRIQRIKPRVNPDVNRWWICDRGRYGYSFIDAATRTKTPRLLGKDADWNYALQKAAELITTTQKQHGPGSISALIAPTASNEDAFMALRLFRERLNIPQISSDIPSSEKLTADQLLLTDDPYSNRRGFQDLGLGPADGGMNAEEIINAVKAGQIKGLIVVGTDLESLVGKQVESITGKLDWLIVGASQENQLWNRATVGLPLAVYAEYPGTFTNVKGMVQKFEKAVEPLGQALPQWQVWHKLAGHLGADWRFDDARAVFKALSAGKPDYESLNWHATFGVDKGCYPDNW
ncbi:MAG: 2Fe-2S iron-sulfur cluster-binding protein [bacterium]|nr:2Fe-2S iron-sulfur cluster-binding protein [bacterium]